MSRLILAFIRHGDYQQLPQTPSAHQPFALNENGITQTQQAAENLLAYIQQENWQLQPQIDSSQMLRAWQTAAIFRDILQPDTAETLHIKSYDGLAERSVGACANLTLTQIEQIVHDDPRYDALPANWKSDSHFRLPFQGAESLIDAGKRVAEHLIEQMATITPDKQPQLKLFVGHGAAFRHAAYHLGVLDFEDIAKLSMYHSQPVFLELLDDGSWQHIAGDWKQRALNNDGID